MGGTEMKHLGDIAKINGAEIEIVDVITGGSPCQDLSIAGKRAGLAGARSGLFMEQVRIVKEMREHDRKSGRTGDMVRPRFMVWENVPGAFSSNKGRDFAAVLEEIIRIAEPEAPDIEVPEKGWNTWGGYHDEVGGRWSVAWRVHDAQYWGVPQRRRRISIVADFGGDTAGEILFERKSVSGHPAESGTARERLAGNAESGASYAVRIMGGCDGGGKDALVQEDKSGTLGTGNDQTIFCLQGNGIDRADTAGCNGKGWREDTSYTLNTIDRPAVCAGVRCLTPWEAQSARVYDQDGVWHSLNANENGGMARDSVMCAGFKLGNSEQARSIGYAEEQSPTLNAECGGNKPAVMCLNDQGGNVMGVSHDISGTLRAQEHGHQPAVMAFAQNQREEVRSVGDKAVSLAAEVGMHCQTFVALDMSHACDVIRDCGEIAPSLQARMGTGGNQVPLTYQDVTGTLSPGAHAGSYNGQDAYNDMLVCGATPDVAHALRAKAACAYREDAETYPVQNMVVRRLTPMECERLQGYPDGWTDIGEWCDSKGKRHKDADSPRYKALGNSIALPFWNFLAKRISAQYLRPVTMGSLFDGIGGFPLVFERHNGKGTARWASEIEEFPIAVTKLRFGED
jgi:DNA (cytosine-5)-methyltransferase 1